MVKDKLKLPVRVAKPVGLSETLSDPSYAVAAGLVMWGFDQEFGDPKSKGSRLSGDANNFKKLLDWLKNFLP